MVSNAKRARECSFPLRYMSLDMPRANPETHATRRDFALSSRWFRVLETSSATEPHRLETGSLRYPPLCTPMIAFAPRQKVLPDCRMQGDCIVLQALGATEAVMLIAGLVEFPYMVTSRWSM